MRRSPISARAVKPDYASGYNSRAWSLHMKGGDAKGLAAIEQAIALDANNAAYIETRTEIFEKLGEHEKAITDYRATLKLDPTYDVERGDK